MAIGKVAFFSDPIDDVRAVHYFSTHYTQRLALFTGHHSGHAVVAVALQIGFAAHNLVAVECVLSDRAGDYPRGV